MASTSVPTLKDIKLWEQKTNSEFGNVDLDDLDEVWEEVYGEDYGGIICKYFGFQLR